MREPVVSIICDTFNHGNYIRQCIDGFLMQKTDFAFEVLIHDDASSDGTADIIREYEAKYPEIIKPIYQTINQYSQKINIWEKFQFPRANGKYIALCEGDDYWTDSLKLQKQVNFLEANKDYSLCVGGFKKFNLSSNESDDIILLPENVLKTKNGFTFTLNNTKERWLTKTLTAVFYNDKNIFNQLGKYKYCRDIDLFYHLLKTGKGFYFTEVLGVYRIHEGGVNSMKQGKVNSNAAYNVYKELYLLNKDEFSRYMYLRNTLALLNYNLYNKYKNNTFINKLQLFFEAIPLVRTLKEFIFLFTALLSPHIKSKYKKWSLYRRYLP